MIDTSSRALSGFLFVLLLSLPAGRAVAAPGTFVQSVSILGTGLSSPIGIANAGDGSGRLFLVERCGQIRILENGALRGTPFLNLGVSPGTDVISCGGERGLLGLAFHPSYETNGLFYVYYTRKSDGAITIARYQVSGDPNVASPTGTVLLTIPHPDQANHNGGSLVFGPDGYLYAGTGDGGGGGDPYETGQNLNSLLGKILRIDVNGDDFPGDSTKNYAIPATNPFVGVAGADEIWAYGVRNPWRFSFDPSGNLFIGDVGQNNFEEIDFGPAGTGGRNYGWDCREAAHTYNDTQDIVNMPPVFNADCSGKTFIDPILEYDHSTGCSVTGGYVFRNLPSHSFFGNYIYSDFCGGQIWRGIPNGGGGWTSTQINSITASFGVSSFGESESGRLYVTYLGSGTTSDGSLRWIAPYTFQDVVPTYWAWPSIEAIFGEGITQGCTTAPAFCPTGLVSRAEMAVFLVRAIHGADFTPPAPTGIFSDVPTTYWAADFIEQLYADGITQGCATSPLRFCPDSSVGRAEMAIFLLRAKHGSSYAPPPATGTVFSDVPANYWSAPWIEQLYAEGISNGCAVSPLRYCPASSVQRDQMAVFLARALELTLP